MAQDAAGPSKPAVAAFDTTNDGSTGTAVFGPLKAVGDFMLCGECGNKFTIVSTPSKDQT